MVNVRKRGNVYEYNFDVAKIEGKISVFNKNTTEKLNIDISQGVGLATNLHYN